MSKKLQFNISKITRIFVRRKFKDTLFRRAFSDKKDLLDLYNALNGTSYMNPDELEITTLEDAIYMSMKNDVSFIISSTLNLYEHQSTVNPNMPIRGLMYFARQYEAYIKLNELDIHGSRLVKLPTPKYVVFYNGREDLPDKQVLKLSDAFIDRTCPKVSDLECRATVLNINYGHNEQTLKACKRLNDYSIFISKVNEGLDKNLSLKNAISEAISYCIENDILYDILVKQKSEVMSMILTEYNEKLHMKTVRNEGYDDGYDKGYGNGYDSGYDEGAKSRQQEVDALNTEVNALNSEVASMKLVTQSKDSEIEQLKKQIEEFYTFKLD